MSTEARHFWKYIFISHMNLFSFKYFLYSGKIYRCFIHLYLYIMAAAVTAKSTFSYLVFTGVFSTPQTCTHILLGFTFLSVMLSFVFRLLGSHKRGQVILFIAVGFFESLC